MTQKEIDKFLANTKVYVNGKSKEIQEKLFSFGYGWGGRNHTEISYVNEPFLFIYKQNITHSNDMHTFIECKHREISADEILSLEITEPSYRPFKTKDECWNEMQKHQPLGWLISKESRNYICVSKVSTSITSNYALIVLKDIELYADSAFNNYTFLDGTPFGIKEE